MLLKRKIIIILCLIQCAVVSAQINGKLMLTNCETAEEKYDCLYQTSGNLIMNTLSDDMVVLLHNHFGKKDTLKIKIDFVVNKKGKIDKDFFDSNLRKMPIIEKALFNTLNTELTFVTPLNTCGKPVITHGGRLILPYVLSKENNTIKLAELIPWEPKKKGDQKLTVGKRVPIYPGCKKYKKNNKMLKKCFSRNVKTFIGSSFRKSVSLKIKEKYGSCLERAYARFVINKEGKIDKVRGFSAYPEMAAEIERVLKEMRKSKPGINKDKPVNVPYIIPVVVQFN